MEKAIISVLLALLVSGGIAGAIYISSSGDGKDALIESVTQLRDEVGVTRDAVTKLQADFAGLKSSQTRLADTLRNRPALAQTTKESKDKDESMAATVPASFVSDDLRANVFALISEERTIREEERRREQEERDKRREERRKEAEELSKGPYDRLNLKVNSMAKALNLNDAQRDKYFEISKKYSDKIQEARAALFAARNEGQQEGDAQGGGPRGRGGFRGEGMEKMRELYDTTQKEYAGEIGAILTAPQLEVYGQLSPQSQSFASNGMAVPAGEDDGGFGGRGGGIFEMMGGGRQGPGQGGPAGQAGPGGQGGGRGGRGGR